MRSPRSAKLGRGDVVSADSATIGLRLADARRALGLTQSQLAEIAGVTQGTVANYENGKHGRMRTLEVLAAALGVPMSVLLAPANGNVALTMCIELAPLLERMPEQSRAELVNIARIFAAA